jgi:hypothetical protein
MTITLSQSLPPAPYPGLRPFEQDEWTIFFGRERMVSDVISLIYDRRLVVVHGASGSGKSSLITAGVLPALELEHVLGEARWRIATLKPSQGPVKRLEQILEEHFPAERFLPTPDGAGEDADLQEGWGERILRGSAVLLDIEAALSKDGGGHFCLLIDQFEELFRLPKWDAEAEAALIVDILNKAGERDNGAAHVLIILTMRSDYLGHCARFEGFAETVNACQYLLPKMDNFSLLLAIQEPAKMYGGSIDAAVADRLLTSTLGELDRLPVMQHALMRACAQARTRGDPGWTVQLPDLDAIGGAAGALAQHADQVLAEATTIGSRQDPERLEALEWIFRSLTDIDGDGLGVRRTRRFSELVEVAGSRVSEAQVRALLDRFRAPDCSFLSPYGDDALGGDTPVEVSHEALIRKWGRLSDRSWESNNRQRGWIWREFQDGLIWRALALLAQGPNTKLGPAATAQRLPWFETIRKRPGWSRRYRLDRKANEALASSSTTPPQLDDEWIAVSALIERSKRRLIRARGIFAVPLTALVLVLLFWAGLSIQYQQATLGLSKTTPVDVVNNFKSCTSLPPWDIRGRNICYRNARYLLLHPAPTLSLGGLRSADTALDQQGSTR